MEELEIKNEEEVVNKAEEIADLTKDNKEGRVIRKEGLTITVELNEGGQYNIDLGPKNFSKIEIDDIAVIKLVPFEDKEGYHARLLYIKRPGLLLAF